MAGNFTESDKHLIILTPGFPEDELDFNCLPSVQGYIQALAKEIGPQRITVLSFQYPFEKGWYQWKGINVYSAGGKNKRGIFRIFTFLKIKKVFAAIRKQHPEIVIHSLWLTATAYLGQQFASRYNLTHIASILGQDALSSNHYLKLMKKEKLQIVANSQFSADQLTVHFQSKLPVMVIPLGINPEQYEQLTTSTTQYDLVTAGSFTELKRYHLFIELVKDLKKDFPQLKVAMAGDGPLRKKLQQQIAEEGLITTISLLGAIPNNTILKLFHQSKIFVHTSRYEASSHAILEAGYAGIPTVCFKVGFHPVKDMIYPCSDLAEMKIRITSLLSQPIHFVPTPVPLIHETVKQYRELYGI
ncbi:hypothetical protein BH11BAC2_BH11BAC2_09040 [soil metagenome]